MDFKRLGDKPDLAMLTITPNGRCPSRKCQVRSSCFGVSEVGSFDGNWRVGKGLMGGSCDRGCLVGFAGFTETCSFTLCLGVLSEPFVG